MPRDRSAISDATFRLILASDLGPVTLRKLRAHFDDDESITKASQRELTEIDGIGDKSAGAIRRAISQADLEAERRAMNESNVRMIVQGDDDYPSLLAAIHDPPPALWIRGELKAEDQISVAIVGSRRCTVYGREQASRFAALLAQTGLTIVSGGASGIDGEAHRGALRVNGRTIVVAGCGLGSDYPPEHKDLFASVVDGGGAIVSEFPIGMPPLATNFPRRNRIISGLSLGVLVIEAGLRSGALITARLAAEDHGREVMAVPGRVDSPASAGCLKIIREGWAALVTSHADVITQLDSSSHLVRGALEASGLTDEAKNATLFDGNLTDGQHAIIEVLKEANDMLLIDQLAARTQRPMSHLMSDLTLLQIRGRVHRDHRGVRLKQVAQTA